MPLKSGLGFPAVVMWGEVGIWMVLTWDLFIFGSFTCASTNVFGTASIVVRMISLSVFDVPPTHLFDGER